ncbi:tetratricopeptide repeat protein [Paenibacillus guangzhouensis]|uniref:tetratricopeptide repeat protein n=1 Tax=Paenibacillus guangzhouensis TaxID=1473112 RepID=UPI00187BAA79|nr:tetratricopeptide repeat protein [Paenibacillus guangzhouensis]
MPQDNFHLQWERDRKFQLAENIQNHYDETLWLEAVMLYQEALSQQPDNPEYLHAYGYLLELKANRLLREANACYRKGLESPSIQQNYAWMQGKLNAQLIRTHAQLLQHQESIAYYKKQLAATPHNPDHYSNLIQCYLQADQTQEAHQVMSAGLKLFASHPMITYYAGEIYARLGSSEKALAAWERSCVLDPQFIDGRYSRAFLFEREHRLEEAAEEWRHIIAFLDQYNFHQDEPQRELQRIEALLNL